MAEFFYQKTTVPCLAGWTVCKKCQNSYNTERTRRKRHQEERARVMSPDHKKSRTLIEHVDESASSAPVAGPSWAEPVARPSFGDSEDIDDTANSLSSLSLTSEPFLFSPLAFTFSPTKQQAFHFPSIM